MFSAQYGICPQTYIGHGPLLLIEFAKKDLISVASRGQRPIQACLAAVRPVVPHAYINLRNLLAIRLLVKLIIYAA
jgi:hypothetical protein